MAKSKIYTRTGDKGYTSLVGGKRAPKTHPRIEAYGTIDELNAFIAVLSETVEDREDREFFLRIQCNLFHMGAYLATESEEKQCNISSEEVAVLEQEIDRIDTLIPPLKTFILPGGCPSNSWAHVCRAICRRAEREIYRLKVKVEIDSNILQYINRLSDYFFLFSRKQNFIHNINEITWNNPCK
ncbi:MAG: cob(I)yrinic acid a,c-diamide adenosyltransferase [Dysgonamonadaceae bacterium]|jgi:cob(I)alamin adenosyltransferase|nr:cob(I)yrinic acid a,c-diamide adenosyltransferase [Dysgonamonadaceae bacterium]